MRWFKHMAGTRRDERIAAFIDEHGFEGYGFYWSLLEVIADSMLPGDIKCERGYSLTRWAQFLQTHPNKVRKYFDALAEHGLVKVLSTESRIVVAAPNLAKYRDEYSRKSGQSPDAVRRVSHSETDSETEKRKETRSQRQRERVQGEGQSLPSTTASIEQGGEVGNGKGAFITDEERLPMHLRVVEGFIQRIGNGGAFLGDQKE